MFRPEKLPPRLRRLALFTLLLAFLAGGVALRYARGPYEDGPRMLGLRPEVGVSEEPSCVDSGRPRPGQSLSGLLEERGISPADANEFLPRLSALMDLRRANPRDEVRLHSDRTGLLKRLEYRPRGGGGSFFIVSRDSAGIRAWREQEPLDAVVRKYTGEVRGSLYASMMRQGLQPAQVDQFCDIFTCDVDFLTATRDGDRWEMLTEELVDSEGNRVRPGRLLGGRYINVDTPHEAFFFAPELAERARTAADAPALPHDPGAGSAGVAGGARLLADGAGGAYYRADGQSLRRAFLKAPLNYRRISSGYTQRRLHPIFNVVRPHLGVDYAAPYGTPVVAVADGVVKSAGWVRGYGRLLRISHRDGIVTYSAHLSRFAAGLREGMAVTQGQVVGYVGMSGNATGPHLDFRIERNGQFIDPLRFRSSGGESLAAADRSAFLEMVRGYRSALESLDAGEYLGSRDFAGLLLGTDVDSRGTPVAESAFESFGR